MKKRKYRNIYLSKDMTDTFKFGVIENRSMWLFFFHIVDRLNFLNSQREKFLRKKTLLMDKDKKDFIFAKASFLQDSLYRWTPWEQKTFIRVLSKKKLLIVLMLSINKKKKRYIHPAMDVLTDKLNYYRLEEAEKERRLSID